MYCCGFLKVSPPIFTQVFTVLGAVPAVVGDRQSEKVALPLVYALLSSKEERQYKAVLQAIITAADDYGINNCKPHTMMSDFELAIVNAILSKFPGIDVILCFFHLKQSAYRHIQALGLQGAYNDANDTSVRDFCHMLAGLAYVPVRDVRNAYLALRPTAPNVGRMGEFLEYFEQTYITGIPGAGRRARVPPRFEPKLWNIYEATLQGRAATNNSSEGWHNRFATMLESQHPDLWKLIDALKKEQGDTEISILELRLGRKIKAAQKKIWADNQRRIRTVVSNYDRENVLEYLEMIAHYVSFD